jgi:thiol-disulfide isomerase/thioredoxin
MIGAMKRRTLVVGGLGLAGMLAVGWYGWRESARRAPQANRAISPSAVSEPSAQAFFDARLPDLSGQQQALAQWRGEPLVINFWATWCPPCVKEIPDLNALAAKHPRARFVGVAIDTAPNVKEFIAKIPIDYEVVVAGHQGIGMVREFGNAAGGLPFTVLIRPDGSIDQTIMGLIEPQALDAQIERLLASSAM